MKIQRYPGKAVDASLSLDRNNAMVELYEANWYQAHQNFGQSRNAENSSLHVPNNSKQETSSNEDNHSIKSHITNTNGMYSGGSYLKEGVSTLSKYQMNLEQIRSLQQQQKDENIVNTLKDLNGYKTSTIRRKPIKVNNDWDKPLEDEEPSLATNTLNSNNYGTEKRQQRPRQQISIKPPSLKRSQTMIYNTKPETIPMKNSWLPNNTQQHSPTSSSFLANISDNDDLNDKYPTVISKQPQAQKKIVLPANNNCDSSLSSFTTNHQLNKFQPTLPPTKPRSGPTNVNRSKSVRFPSYTQHEHEDFKPVKSPPHYNDHITNTMPKSNNRHRKISLDIKQDLKNNFSYLTDAFENLSVNSQRPSPNQHSRQNSDSSTSSAHSSNASSRNSQKLNDQFVIPRPRLIVPIHTYARKRRTGNLKDQDLETINNEDDVSETEGEIF